MARVRVKAEIAAKYGRDPVRDIINEAYDFISSNPTLHGEDLKLVVKAPRRGYDYETRTLTVVLEKGSI